MACIYIIRQEQEDIIEIDFIFLVRWGDNSEENKNTHDTRARGPFKCKLIGFGSFLAGNQLYDI